MEILRVVSEYSLAFLIIFIYFHLFFLIYNMGVLHKKALKTHSNKYLGRLLANITSFDLRHHY